MPNRKTPVHRRSGNEGEPPAGGSELILYTTADQLTRIEVRLEDETVWLSQRQMAELFQKSVKTINEHVLNVFDEGELDPGPTIRKSRIVQMEGEREVTRLVDVYNLDVIISVGYRVKSSWSRGTLIGWADEGRDGERSGSVPLHLALMNLPIETSQPKSSLTLGFRDPSIGRLSERCLARFAPLQ